MVGLDDRTIYRAGHGSVQNATKRGFDGLKRRIGGLGRRALPAAKLIIRFDTTTGGAPWLALQKMTASARSPGPAPAASLHGITLEGVMEALVARHGWEELGRRIAIRCFTTDPSIKSSLRFLRKTPWARQKVEQLYLQSAA